MTLNLICLKCEKVEIVSDQPPIEWKCPYCRFHRDRMKDQMVQFLEKCDIPWHLDDIYAYEEAAICKFIDDFFSYLETDPNDIRVGMVTPVEYPRVSRQPADFPRCDCSTEMKCRKHRLEEESKDGKS